MKTCAKCSLEKPFTEFYRHRNYSDGYRSECKECSKIYEKARYENAKLEGRTYIKNNQERTRVYSLKTKFGITIEQYNDLLEKQSECCAVCGRHQSLFKRRLAVDHAHKSSDFVKEGAIRGLLCDFCNRQVIGRHTDPVIYEKAAQYLRQDTGLYVPEGRVKGRRKPRKKKRS